MADTVLSRIVVIQNAKGLHARATAKFVQLVSEFDAALKVRRLHCTPPLFGEGEDMWVANGTSVLGILTLGAEKGARLFLEAEGKEAEALLDAVEQLVNEKFQEE